ncbi:hypothetical protein FRX31_015321 [Thalictrum thalictroides]|uniref:Uncharacterized protein n=1 Tax=Thalictrum thalictroides TaxID=46969 RepID=A0A7J6WCN2_THATH|nr:hypothetical protein FRX31_015321 [Thalictrum thalictroides]
MKILCPILARSFISYSILLASGMTRGGPSYSCKAGVLDYARKIETESAFSNVDRFGAGGASMFLEQLRRVCTSYIEDKREQNRTQS